MSHQKVVLEDWVSRQTNILPEPTEADEEFEKEYMEEQDNLITGTEIMETVQEVENRK